MSYPKFSLEHVVTRRTDARDHLDFNLSLRDVVQHLRSTEPTQEARARSCRLFPAPVRQHELDIHVRNTSALPGRYLDHDL